MVDSLLNQPNPAKRDRAEFDTLLKAVDREDPVNAVESRDYSGLILTG